MRGIFSIILSLVGFCFLLTDLPIGINYLLDEYATSIGYVLMITGGVLGIASVIKERGIKRTLGIFGILIPLFTVLNIVYTIRQLGKAMENF